MHPAILEKRDQLVAECRRFAVDRLDLFGSATSGEDFDPVDSDVDFLVTFQPGVENVSFLELEEAFERILGRKIDMIDRRAVENSRNYIRRQSILDRAVPLYVA